MVCSREASPGFLQHTLREARFNISPSGSFSHNKFIRRAIDQFDWVRALSNVNVDEKVYFFTKTLLNIIQNFIPHETIICDDRDPPWINKEIKKLMVEKNLAFKSYCHSNKSMFLFEKFKALQYQLNISIEESKEKYYTKLSRRITLNCQVG